MAQDPDPHQGHAARLSDGDFYEKFCVKPDDGIAEFWRSGGATGAPLFYPRSFEDIRYAMAGFSRIYQCAGCAPGGRAHVSFPLGIHPVGQMLARCATDVGIAVNWAGSGTTTPSVMQIELIDRLKPTIWMGMSSYGLHLANLAEARGLDLAASSVETILCSAEPLSDAKRAKLARQWGAQVRDTFGMTEAGMMGAEDANGGGFRIWTDMFFIEVLDPDTQRAGRRGRDRQPRGHAAVDQQCHAVPALELGRSASPGAQASDGDGPFSVFPLVKHAHRTTGFFKVRGINLNHSEFEDFMFRNDGVADFKAELVERARSRRAAAVDRAAARRGAAAVADGLRAAVRDTFGLTPEVGGAGSRHARAGIRGERQDAALCRPAAIG